LQCGERPVLVGAQLCGDRIFLGKNLPPHGDPPSGSERRGYNTFSGNANEMVIFLKSLVNDLYTRDISRKINSTFETMRAKGQITSGHPPYGYLRPCEDKHRLMVDMEASPVVRVIFK